MDANSKTMLKGDHDMLLAKVYDDDDGEIELGLGLSIGGCGGLRKSEEDLMPCCSSSSSSDSVKIPKSKIVGTKRRVVESVSPPNATSVVGWPPIRRGHRMPILANQIKSEQEELSKINNRHLSVKVNMEGTPIGRKVDLYAHTSYEMLAQTLENMFYGTHNALGSSRLLNGTSDFVLTYEDKDGDCMLVGDVPWQMFLGSVKRLRILRNTNMQH
ncbi:PB1 domain, AUX/IAA protein [Artemisia annua]|uniref:Auxin-responsive protein n=1 Tax=Artemisia annua TaxID=35608 RepID=A0A2U1MP72_ARTAN|nr:PB1 domain, AUX/IAA protein [Artemisia annua]